jgi:hypothetical protein
MTDCERIARKASALLPKRNDNGDPLTVEVEYGVRYAKNDGPLTADSTKWDWEGGDLYDTYTLKNLCDETIAVGMTLDLYCTCFNDDAWHSEQHMLWATWDGRKWNVTEQF